MEAMNESEKEDSSNSVSSKPEEDGEQPRAVGKGSSDTTSITNDPSTTSVSEAKLA